MVSKSQHTPKFYVGGPKADLRMENLIKLSEELFGGNFSKFINTGLNKAFNLDPITGERLANCPTGAPKAISVRGGKNLEKH